MILTWLPSCAENLVAEKDRGGAGEGAAMQSLQQSRRPGPTWDCQPPS